MIELNLIYYDIFKILCGICFGVDLLSYSPFLRKIFGQNYEKRIWLNSARVQNLIIVVWFIGSILLILNTLPILGFGALLLLYRIIYVDARWNNLVRGAGALGIVPYIVCFYGCFTELGLILEPTGIVAMWNINMFRIHIALILICAAFYKFKAGYAVGEGFEYALVNPLWSWYSKIIKNRIKFNNVLNILLGWILILGEGIIGLMLLNTNISFIGASISIFGFFVILLFINLVTLPLLMIAISILFLSESSNISLYVSMKHIFINDTITFWAKIASIPPTVFIFLKITLKIISYSNYYLGINFPSIIQRPTSLLCKYLPVIIWRVFSADVVNIYPRIKYIYNKKEINIYNENQKFINNKNLPINVRYRFYHVLESVTLSSLFLSLRYGENQKDRFVENLVRYCKNLSYELNVTKGFFQFELILLKKQQDGSIINKSNGIIKVFLSDYNIKDERTTMQKTEFEELICNYIKPFKNFGEYIHTNKLKTKIFL